MVTIAQPQRTGPSSFVGIGAAFQSLFSLATFSKAVQRADANRLLDRLLTKFFRCELTVADINQARLSAAGRALSAFPDGRAAMALLHAGALGIAENWEAMSRALLPAKARELTRPTAVWMQGFALEANSDYIGADAVIHELPERLVTQDYLRRWYDGLLYATVVVGIRAMVANDTATFEQAVDRFLALTRTAFDKTRQNSDVRVLDQWDKFLRNDIKGVLEYIFQGNRPSSTTVQKDIEHGIKRSFDLAQKQTKGRAYEALGQFRTAVRLLAIEDLWEGWDALAGEVSSRWPKGRTPIEVIREMRD